MNTCYCGLGMSFETCCEPVIKGERAATTAQELMRSRYSAYATIASDYLVNTTHPSTRKDFSKKDIEAWAQTSRWQKLEILSRTLGGKSDERGEVEFKAYYTDHLNTLQIHHENSVFIKEETRWFYLKGTINPKPQNIGKTNRNDPCPCGSGLKFKKCCG